MSDVLAQYARCQADPWYFLTQAVFTRDQVDAKQPIKRFPADWDYLRLYVKLWEKNRLLAVPKSRRMFMSWANIALHLWAALFHPGSDYAFVSKKEDDAGELIKRAEFIYDHIPDSVIPKHLLPKKEVRAKPASLIFPEIQSKIQGFPMGADQLRQFTFSGILGDESAFWEEAQKFYSAAFPTIEGGGRMTLISSRSPGFFQRLVFDQLDSQADIDETRTPEKHYPFGDESVVIWRNPKNRFLIFNLHYTANPNKRDPAFREAVKNSMPLKDYLVEYETAWNAFDGKPVFEDYSPARHESRTPQEPHLGLPIMLGWDFGLTPACVAAQLRGGTLHILREYVSENMSIEKFAPIVMQQLRQLYPEWNDQKKHYLNFIDPAGLDKAQTDSRTCAGIMSAAGLKNIAPGPLRWEARRKSVEHFLMRHTKEGPGLLLYPPHAPTLQKGFTGGYRYPEKYAEVEPDGTPKPIKNRFSHPHDALQYLCGGALTKSTERTLILIPTPEYSFTHSGESINKRKGEIQL